MTDSSLEAAELHELLALTGEQHRIKRRIDLLRSRVDQRAHDSFAATGVAPTWKLPKLGQVRLDGIDPQPVAYVTDEAEFANWVAQRYPTEAIATIVVPTDALESAVEALGFAGVTTTEVKVVARPTAADSVLGTANLVEQHDGTGEGPRWIVVDQDSEIVPGAAGRIASSPRLVVAVDAKHKAALTEQADLEDADFTRELIPADAEGVA